MPWCTSCSPAPTIASSPRPEDADAVLRGEVTSIGGSAVVFDSATGRATTILVTVNTEGQSGGPRHGQASCITTTISFSANRTKSPLMSQPFSARGPALDRMSRDFAARAGLRHAGEILMPRHVRGSAGRAAGQGQAGAGNSAARRRRLFARSYAVSKLLTRASTPRRAIGASRAFPPKKMISP